MIKATIITLAALAAPVVQADCDRLIFGGWSYHYDRSKDYNENHQMIGIQCQGVSVMRFKNSTGSTSVGVGYEHMPYTWGNAEAGAYVGAWTGYDDWPVAMPVAGARVRYNFEYMGLSLTVGPVVSAIHLEYRF